MVLFTPMNSRSYPAAPSAASLPHREKGVRGAIFALALLSFAPSTAHAALNIPITVNLSESVNVTGTPQIAVDVGGTTRYATYTSGTGTNALTFTLAPQAGDVDLDGVTVSSPIQLNGGTIKDSKGNNATLTFTPPNTANVKVNYPSLGMDFVYDADGRYTLNGTPYNDLSSFLTAAGGTFTRASVGTYFDSSGVMQTATANTPRFDYDPVTHAAKGILIEESRTNLLVYSMAMNTSPWNLARANVQLAATTSPDGTTNAIKLYNNGTSGSVYAGYFKTYTANQTYTYSIFAKKAEISSIIIPIYAVTGWLADGSVTFNLNTGTATTSGTGISAYNITPLPNGWYRCSITAKFGAVDTNGQYPTTALSTNPIDSVSGVYLWGAQLEQGPFATSYIPTTTAAVTRAADTLTIPTGSWFNANAGTLLSISNMPFVGGTGFPGTVAIDNGVMSNAMYMYILDSGSDQKSMGLYNGGVQQAAYYGAAYSAGSTTKQGLAYAVNNVIAAADGTLSTLDTNATIPTVTQLRVGATYSAALNGHSEKVKYYPARVPDAQLQLLTQ